MVGLERRHLSRQRGLQPFTFALGGGSAGHQKKQWGEVLGGRGGYGSNQDMSTKITLIVKVSNSIH